MLEWSREWPTKCAKPFLRSGERWIIGAAASGLPDPRAELRDPRRPEPVAAKRFGYAHGV